MHSDEPADAERPSRSARRRDALDVLTFARQLSELPPARTAGLELPDDVREELAVLRATPSHIARKRELGHLARVLRAHGIEAFAGARAALANDRAASAQAAARLHRIEALRTSLLDATDDAALTAFIAAHPTCDRQRLRALLRQARRERATDRPPRAQRELFRLLRELQEPPIAGA